MAKPIKETPYLKGKDAVRFSNANKTVAKVSAEESKQIKESFQNLKRIATFAI